MKLAKLTNTAVAVLIVIITLGSLPGIYNGAQSALAQETFSDDFEGSFGGGWEIARGNGSIEFENGKMIVFADAAGVFVRPLSADGSLLQYDDVTIDFEATVPNELNAQVGVVARADFDTFGEFGFPFSYIAGYDSDKTAQIFNIRSAGFQGLDGDDSIFEINGGPVRSKFDVRGTAVEFESMPIGLGLSGYRLVDESRDHTAGEVGFYVRPFGGDTSLGVEFDNVKVVPEPRTSLGSLGLIAILIGTCFRSRNR